MEVLKEIKCRTPECSGFVQARGLCRQCYARWNNNGIRPDEVRPIPETCEMSGCSNPAEHMDHDHQTGEFRGWLCNVCNRGLALLGDDEEGVVAALEYIREST